MNEANAFEVWDADNHMYETIDAYTRYLPEKYSEALKFVDVNGRKKLQILGIVTECIPNPTYEVIPTPGAWADYYRGINPEGKTLRELAEPIRCPDEFRRPDLRLALMDRQGVDGAVMFPTTAGMLEERTKSDTELTHAVTHAFNRWLLEDWTFNYQNRIFAVPAISLNDPALGRSRTRVVSRERRADSADPAGTGTARRRHVEVTGAPRVRRLLAPGRVRGHLSADAQFGLRVRPLRRRLGEPQ